MRQYIFLLFVLSIASIQAQEHVRISKEELILKSLESNIEIKIAEQNLIATIGDLESTKSLKLPNIHVSYAGLTTNQPLTAFGTKLNQSRIEETDFNPAFLNDPNHIEDFYARLEIQQPILNLDVKHYQKAADSKVKATDLQLSRKKDYLILEVEKQYLQLQLAYKSRSVLNSSLTLSQEIFRQAKNKFDQGLLQKSDLLATEIRLKEIENQIIYANSHIANISTQLSVLSNQDPNTIWLPADSLLYLPNVNIFPALNVNRSDIQSIKFVAEAYQHQLTADKKSTLPRMSSFASYELHNDDIITGSGHGYLVGLNIHWNILGRKKMEGKLKKSRAELEHAKLQYQNYILQNQQELLKISRALQDAQKNIELSNLGVDQTREVLRIRKNRFNEGLERTTDLLQAESSYADKQLEYIRAIFQYNTTLAYLTFLTKE